MAEEQARRPDEQELADAMYRELAQLRVDELLASTVATLHALVTVRLGRARPEDRDLAEARRGIDVLEVIAGQLGEGAAALRDPIAQLKFAYVQAVDDERRGSEPAGEPGSGAEPSPEPAPPEDAAAHDRPPIWTPRGEV